MSFRLNRMHAWSCEVADEVGGVAEKLALLAQAGADLEFIYTTRLRDKPGRGVLFVTPLTGPLQLNAARSAGFAETDSPILMRVAGDNQQGLATKLTQAWASAQLNMAGLSMAVLEQEFVGYVSFDTVEDANRAAAILGDLGAAEKKATNAAKG